MRQLVKGRINSFLIDPKDYQNVYFGVSDRPPGQIDYYLDSINVYYEQFKSGFSVSYKTLDKGQYEILAYPKSFGDLESIIQNDLNINILKSWVILETIKNKTEYYLCYTSLPQYQDVSTYTFKALRNSCGEVYFGEVDDLPIDIYTLQRIPVLDQQLELGLELTYTTAETGQYEAIAYSKNFGELSLIKQNGIGINILKAWIKEEVTKGNSQYYLYHTQLPQYQDTSTFLFKI